MDKNCERFSRLISDRLDGRISSADESALQAHLELCEECRSFEVSARLCRVRLQSLPDLAVDSPDSIPAARTEVTRKFWGRQVSLPIPLAAALAVLMLAGWLLALRPSGMPAASLSPRAVLVRSVEIIRVEPAKVAPAAPSRQDSVTLKEEVI